MTITPDFPPPCRACGTAMLACEPDDYCFQCEELGKYVRAFPNRVVRAVEHFVSEVVKKP
jgi:hypothetical protein